MKLKGRSPCSQRRALIDIVVTAQPTSKGSPAFSLVLFSVLLSSTGAVSVWAPVRVLVHLSARHCPLRDE